MRRDIFRKDEQDRTRLSLRTIYVEELEYYVPHTIFFELYAKKGSLTTVDFFRIV